MCNTVVVFECNMLYCSSMCSCLGCNNYVIVKSEFLTFPRHFFRQGIFCGPIYCGGWRQKRSTPPKRITTVHRHIHAVACMSALYRTRRYEGTQSCIRQVSSNKFGIALDLYVSLPSIIY